jgi:hypothetical protein
MHKAIVMYLADNDEHGDVFSLADNLDGKGTVISRWETDVKKPTKAQIASYQKKVDAEESLNAYKGARVREYPAFGEQLDALWHAMDRGELPQVEGFYDIIKAVKDKHPKTEV